VGKSLFRDKTGLMFQLEHYVIAILYVQ
jgi:hypothetical protein